MAINFDNRVFFQVLASGLYNAGQNLELVSHALVSGLYNTRQSVDIDGAPMDGLYNICRGTGIFWR